MGETKIEWADRVWNPVSGCTKVSEGCRHCWAKRMSKRLAGRCGYPKENPFKVTCHPEKLNEPLRWKKPQTIFVGSMGDLFHDEVEWKYLDEVFAVMSEANHHTYLLLTKRPAKIKAQMEAYHGNSAPPHIWLGVSVENKKTADERIPILLQTPAAKRFVSYEPALGPVDFYRYLPKPLPEDCIDARACLDPEGCFECVTLDWIIMGGESGPGARPMHPDWARSVRDQCKAAGVPFFLKQIGEWEPDGEVPFKEPKEANKVIPMYTVWSSAGPHERGRLDSYHIYDENGQGTRFKRVGKKAAGCLLDGNEHKDLPK